MELGGAGRRTKFRVLSTGYQKASPSALLWPDADPTVFLYSRRSLGLWKVSISSLIFASAETSCAAHQSSFHTVSSPPRGAYGGQRTSNTARSKHFESLPIVASPEHFDNSRCAFSKESDSSHPAPAVSVTAVNWCMLPPDRGPSTAGPSLPVNTCVSSRSHRWAAPPCVTRPQVPSVSILLPTLSTTSFARRCGSSSQSKDLTASCPYRTLQRKKAIRVLPQTVGALKGRAVLAGKRVHISLEVCSVTPLVTPGGLTWIQHACLDGCAVAAAHVLAAQRCPSRPVSAAEIIGGVSSRDHRDLWQQQRSSVVLAAETIGTLLSS